MRPVLCSPSSSRPLRTGFLWRCRRRLHRRAAVQQRCPNGTFSSDVDHKFGTATVPAAPERVVNVGLTEQDTLLQLGVTPVALTEWYGEQPHATWPWATALLGDAEPEVLSASDGFEFKKIAALEPDLIIGVNAGMTESDYELLSAIAPTVTSVKGSTQYLSDWQDQTLQIARAPGREDDGQRLVDDVGRQYTEAASAHPEWACSPAPYFITRSASSTSSTSSRPVLEQATAGAAPRAFPG